MSDELGYEEEERYFNFETYVRWYEAIEKAVVIWLYYLGVRVDSGIRRSGGHRYHEAVLESLGHPDNPFFDIFDQYYLLTALREDKKLRNEWRHGKPLVMDLHRIWPHLTGYLRFINAALGDALKTFSEIRVGIW